MIPHHHIRLPSRKAPEFQSAVVAAARECLDKFTAEAIGYVLVEEVILSERATDRWDITLSYLLTREYRVGMSTRHFRVLEVDHHTCEVYSMRLRGE